MAWRGRAVEVPGSRRVSGLIWYLLVLMALDIGRATVQGNVSYLDLQRYAHLQAASPYQQRWLMVLPLRAAESSAHFHWLWARLFGRTVDSPDTLVLILVNCFCLLALLPVTVALRRSFAPRPLSSWLAPLVLLWVVAFTYAVRYEQRFVLPYDLPSLLFYNLGLLAIVRRRAGLLLLLLVVAIPNRETAVFLLAPSALLFWRDGRRWAAVLVSVAGLGIFLLWRVEIAHFLQTPWQPYVYPWKVNLRALLLPLHWPQLFSVFGFLALPLWALRAEVQDRRVRDLWLASLPFVTAALVVGIWWETRIFGELSALVAVTFALEIEAQWGRGRVPASLVGPPGQEFG